MHKQQQSKVDAMSEAALARAIRARIDSNKAQQRNPAPAHAVATPEGFTLAILYK